MEKVKFIGLATLKLLAHLSDIVRDVFLISTLGGYVNGAASIFYWVIPITKIYQYTWLLIFGFRHTGR